MYIAENEAVLRDVLAAYDFPETPLGVVRYGSGHINDTYCVVCQPQEGKAVRFILQGLSKAAFPNQEELLEEKADTNSFTKSERDFLGAPRDFKKNQLKHLKKQL